MFLSLEIICCYTLYVTLSARSARHSSSKTIWIVQNPGYLQLHFIRCFGLLFFQELPDMLYIFKITQVCHIAKVTRLISAAAQKLISDVAYDALQVTGWPEPGNLLG